MIKDYPLSELERFVDGECSPEEAERIRTDVAKDASLAQTVGRLDELNQAVRASAREIEAPDTLRRAVMARYAPVEDKTMSSPGPSPAAAGRRLGRRAMLVGTGSALAAGIAGLVLLPRLTGRSGAELDPVATFFHDFETYLAKDKAIDIAEGNMVRLAGWFGKRLPFDLPPVSSAGGDARLVGGRLCWLMDRRLASLSYSSSSGPIVLYIMDAKGITPPTGHETSHIGDSFSWHRSANHTCLIWTSDSLMFVMVGTQEVRKMMSIASSLVG